MDQLNQNYGKLFESCKLMEFRGLTCKVYDSGTNLFLSGIISKTPLVSLKYHLTLISFSLHKKKLFFNKIT